MVRRERLAHEDTVDSAGQVGQFNSLALDSSDRPHISYYEVTNDWWYDNLRYAWWPASNHAPVANAGPDYTATDWDGSGMEQVTLDGSLSKDVDGTITSYSWKEGAVEQSTQVSPQLTFSVGSHTLTLTVEDNDGATDTDTVVVTVQSSSDWSCEIVDNIERVGYDMSVALDASDRPHISYEDWTNGDLKYAWYDGTNWHTTRVDSVGHVGAFGTFTSLALDSRDYPHISYKDDTSEDLRYAWYDGSAWHTTTVDNVGDLGGLGSLALDGSDRPHISYLDDTSEDLKYAWYDGSNWHTTTVDYVGRLGGEPSLVLDASDRPHISYYENINHDLKYAWYDKTDWHTTTVDNVGLVGVSSSLALDSSDHPHISYEDYTNDDIKYAWYDGSDWHTTTVDSAGEVAGGTSLALDGSDRPHISYEDWSNGDLKYAWYDKTDWHTTTVESAGYTNGLSLALDSSDHAHISYFEDNNDDLKYCRGPIKIVSTPASFRVDSEGNLFADQTVHAAGFVTGSADVAEWVAVSEPVNKADVLELDSTRIASYRLSSKACSSLVAGVVSTHPGMTLGGGTPSIQQALLALTGIVPVKVTNEGGPIQPGDLLVSSSTPGYAMRWDGEGSCPCALVGKALEPFHGEKGIIEVLLTAH